MLQDQKKFRVTLVRSPSKKLKSHKATIAGLGLRRMHHAVYVIDNPCTRGMIQQVSYLIKVEEI